MGHPIVVVRSDVGHRPRRSAFLAEWCTVSTTLSRPDAKMLGDVTPGILGPDYFREIVTIAKAAAGGPPAPPALAEVMRGHGLTRFRSMENEHWLHSEIVVLAHHPPASEDEALSGFRY
jgi:hypothetical protein